MKAWWEYIPMAGLIILIVLVGIMLITDPYELLVGCFVPIMVAAGLSIIGALLLFWMHLLWNKLASTIRNQRKENP